MKDKSLADEWFQNYMYATDELIKSKFRIVKYTLLSRMTRSKRKQKLYQGQLRINKNISARFRELQLNAAKTYEYYSEHPLPKVTRKSLGLN